MAAVREALAAGKVEPNDEVWDPLLGSWLPLSGMLGAAAAPAVAERPVVEGHSVTPGPSAGTADEPAEQPELATEADGVKRLPRGLWWIVGAVALVLGGWTTFMLVVGGRDEGGVADARATDDATSDAALVHATPGLATAVGPDQSPPPPPPSPPPPPAPPLAPPPPSRSERFQSDVDAGRDLSHWCWEMDMRPPSALWKVCEGLARAVKTGYTDQPARIAFQKYFSNSDARSRSGYLVAQLSQGEYEVKMSGDRLHAILHTKATSFSSQGWFNIWVRKTGTQSVQTVDGFLQEWNVYEEDLVSSSIDFVRSAPRGEETSSTARAALILIVGEHL